MRSKLDFYDKWAENNIGYKFVNIDNFLEAITHPSMTLKNKSKNYKKSLWHNYERLEFLGDTVLSMIITEELIRRFPNEKEGDLAKRRVSLVCRGALVEVALKLKIDEIIIISESEKSCNGAKKDSNLENCLEAIVGALYWDGGIETARKFVIRFWSDIFDRNILPPKDPKTELQEWAQKKGFNMPKYVIHDRSGPAHDPVIKVKLTIDGVGELFAESSSKKKAEIIAAKIMLSQVL